MSFKLPSIPDSFTSPYVPKCEIFHEHRESPHFHRPKPSNALYYNTFCKCILTPIAIIALPLIALISLIYVACYRFIKKVSFQDLVARKLGLLALSLDPLSLAEIRKKKRPLQISTVTEDGIKLSGVQINKSTSNKWIVALNGTTGTWEGNLDTLTKMSDLLNANIVSFNYRGVGLSKGYCRSSDDITCDGVAMVEYLRKKGVPEHDIIIYGHSLGGGVGAQVVSKYKKIKFITDRSFDAFDKAAIAFLWIPIYREIVAFIISKWWKLDSYKALSKVSLNRIMIILAKQDYIIQGDSSLYSAYVRNKKKPPITITLKYPIDKNLCCLSRCNELGRSHIWDLPEEISPVLNQFITN